VGKTITTYIGYKEDTPEIAKFLIKCFNQEYVELIEIKARGKHILKAIDVLELVKRQIKRYNTTITTSSQQFKPSNDAANPLLVELIWVPVVNIKIKKNDILRHTKVCGFQR
jgi:DNA-binding protein